MPILNDNNMKKHRLLHSRYGFSGKRIDRLDATEYTLVAIAADVSGSVGAFRDEIEECVKEIIKSCRASPRADNLMLRLVTFDDSLSENHGFKPLSDCHLDDYDGSIEIGGMTALYDASVNAIEAVSAYGKELTENGFGANGIVFVITDGADNHSTHTASSVRDTVRQVLRGETMESLNAVLVGVNVGDPQLSGYLKSLHRDAGFMQYVEIAQADAGTLARLADFVSRSIAAQSRALGSGSASISLSF